MVPVISTISVHEAMERLKSFDPEAWEALHIHLQSLQAKVDQANMRPLGLE